ncbi:MAG: hypothetical protein KJ971_01315 [Firmicutes bacterium]|nr:hypothetical protein [Bacillota bacterium]
MKFVKKSIIIFLMFFMIGFSFLSMLVFADVDKTNLQIARDEVEQSQINFATYENNSFQAFSDIIDGIEVGGLIGIDAVLDDPLASIETVENLTTTLTNALDGLVTSATYDATLINYLVAKNKDVTLYTLRSRADYTQELDIIKAILDEPTSGEIIINGLNDELVLANDLLVLLADKTELISLYDEASSVYSGDGTIYTPSSFLNFKNLYDDVDSTLFLEFGNTVSEILADSDASVIETSRAEALIQESLDLLVYRPDKSTLILEYDTAIALDLSIYTLDSGTLFLEELNSINTVIDNLEALEIDVENARVELTEAYNLLIVKADITLIETAYLNAINFTLTPYTPNSKIIFLAEIERIRLIMIDENIIQSIADLAFSDLEAAYNLLVLIADKSDLIIKNNQSIIAYYEEKAIYTQASYELFKQAFIAYGTYLYVNQLIADTNISQTEVNAVTAIIEEALALLVPLENNEELLNRYNTLMSLDLTAFTPLSQEAFFTEVDRLYLLIISKDLDQTLYDIITTDLSQAEDLLLEKADITALEAVYLIGGNKNEEKYSISSFSALQIQLLNAEVILQNSNSLQAEVDQVKLEIETAISELTLKAETLFLKAEIEQINVNQYVTLGKSNIILYTSSDTNILTVDENGNVKGVQYGEGFISIELANGVVEVIYFIVKANIETATLVLAISIPVISTGIGLSVVLLKTQSFSFLKKLFVFKRRIK